MATLAVVCTILLLAGLTKALRKTHYSPAEQKRTVITTAIVIAAWLLLTSVLALKGFFADFNALPPRPALLIFVPLPFVLFVAFSRKFAVILKATPPQWLIGMQAFRIVVELLLLRGYIIGLLPKQMTFEGGNIDILSGILAILVAIAINKKYNAVLITIFNVIGLLLLLNILIIAVLSMPTPLRVFMNEPSAALVGEFPFSFLPGVLVVLAYSLHIFSLRQVAVRRKGKH